ncbi:MAG: hypothetical protein JOZ75_05475 [Candidatus Dormibacteraeota bacterium]|nr:hypothetical protein [Candidatus Dormibacteraeota bacterium]
MSGKTDTAGQAWIVMAAGAVGLVLLWRLVPPTSPPLYDGLCTPAPPYRHLGGSPPPLSASATYFATAFPAAEVQTGETPPQAQVLMMAGTFSAPSTVTVAVTPVAPPAPPPRGMLQDGNAYRVSATTGGQELQPSPQNPVTVELLGSGSSSALVLYASSGDGWTALRTFNLGCGITFEAVAPKLGYFALFRTAGAPSSGGFPIGIVVAILGALIVIATLVLARFAAARRR